MKLVRDKVDDFHSQWFELAKNKVEAVGADSPSIPPWCGWQRNRDNTPAEEPREYFKRTITIPFSWLQRSGQSRCVHEGAAKRSAFSLYGL